MSAIGKVSRFIMIGTDDSMKRKARRWLASRRRPHVGRCWANHASRLLLLQRVGNPAGAARDRKRCGERLAWDADGIEQYGGHHFHVCWQAAARFEACEDDGQPFFKVCRELQAAPAGAHLL